MRIFSTSRCKALRRTASQGLSAARSRLLPCALCLVPLLASSCTRSFYRRAADREVEEVLTEKDRYPGGQAWKIEQWHVYPDPHARFADPTNPDRPPKPPDDRAAFDLAPNPQKPGHAGVARVEGQGYIDILAAWDAENRAAKEDAKRRQDEAALAAGSLAPGKPVEPKDALPKGKAETPAPAADSKEGLRKPFLINLEQSVHLGMINSREFQDRREDLYLTALPVTLERFAFAAQFFATEQAIYTYAGRDTPTGHQNNWALNSNVGFAKLFPTGAVLLFRIANQTVFDLANGAQKTTSSVSNLTLDLAQPLLRGGGRAVTLEPLTQSERNLLYQIRSYARFRKEFFVAIAGGGGGSISGGTFQPTGVIAAIPFSPTAGLGGTPLLPGIVAPAPPTPGLNVTPGSAGRLNLGAAIAAPVSGYLGTVLQYAQIGIDEGNIANLQDFLKRFQAIKEGGDVSQLQVDNVEQSLLLGRTTLITDVQQYGDAIDRFKLQLGLPTDLPLELDDEPIRPLLRQFAHYDEVIRQYQDVVDAAGKLSSPQGLVKTRADLLRLFEASPLARGTRFAQQVGRRWSAWEKLGRRDEHKELRNRLSQFRAERQKLLDLQTDLEEKGQQLAPADKARLDEAEFEIGLGEFELILRYYEEQREPPSSGRPAGRLWKDIMDPDVRRRQQESQFRDVVAAFANVLVEPRNERLDDLRQKWPKLPRLCVGGRDLLQMDETDAYGLASQTALVNRFDLMNVRAQMVDAWRQIAVFANALLGTVNVEYNLTSNTPLGLAQPLNFGGSRNTHRVSINAELPLVRLNERNNYRAALIAYQRERRTLMEAEDLVLQGVRGEIRQLRVLAENYTIQQRQVELAYRTVESSLEALLAPPAPTGGLGGGAAGGAGGAGAGAAFGGGGGGAGNAAALTQQLLNAQNSLVRAQNQLLTVWINYVSTRYQLYRDLELMPLDYRGVWIDDPAACDSDPCQPGGPASPGPSPESPGQPPERLPEPKPSPPAEAGPKR